MLFSAPLYFEFGTSSAETPGSYDFSTYGPEPVTLLSVCSLCSE